ncbi:MFS transporter [Mycolicibacterium cosmeticum]|uniref:Sialic acid-transport integral membrane protein NanT n=1 Tax=Mycolicibacterium cosmeticum TaxID=258533 RepID=W9BKZ8_MYCCO|nr:MFS transporter [Mycolicibacterium cosmeticum]TLH73354.1 MFS transporter [Mycolicibacterium cosmeticum]CDO08775.1 sialic acid-transport integral membrane protein NanT [Mycolicibacterium cosmeticum]
MNPAPEDTQKPTLRRVSARETRRASGIAFLAWTIAVYDFILFGTLLPRIEESFGWSTSYALLVSTLVSVGTAVVVLGVGPMVDKLGRRRGMIISVAGTAASSAATAATAGAASLIGVRSISGLGLAEQSVNATYLNELYELTEDEKVRRNRGFVYSMVQTGWPLGALLAAGFVAVVSAVFGADAWRLAFLLATVPAILVALLCRTLRESPQFELQQRIRKLRKDGDAAGAARLAAAHDVDQETAAPFRRIFHGVHLRNTVVLSVAWLFNWFAIQTFSVLGTTVLETGKGIDASNTLLMVVVSNLVGALGYLAHGWAGDRFGRRNTIAVGWLLSGGFFAAMLLGPSTPVYVIVTYMMGLFFLLGPYAAILFFQAECFAVECRATGSSFIGAMSQPGAIVAGFILTALTAAAVPYSAAALYVGAVGAVLSAVAVLFARTVAPVGDAEKAAA